MVFTRTVIINFLLIVLAIIFWLMINLTFYSHYESPQNFTTRAKNLGYLSERHRIITEDGFVLNVFRMRNKSCLKKMRTPPVILQHGLLMSSDSWLVTKPKAGLLQLLADSCFDMWVGNCRGNFNSREHISLEPDKDAEYWQWSVDEIGKYDVPAIIDHVLKFTKSTNINYIGFSQGAGSYLIMCSERTEYCHKARILISLSPAGSLSHATSKFARFVFTFVENLHIVFSCLGINEIFNMGGLIQMALQFMCPIHSSIREVCIKLVAMVDAFHEGSISFETTNILFQHVPAGTSVQNIVKYSQTMRSVDFVKFDYGKKKNLEAYGQENPPIYNLTAATIPILMVHGKNDHLVDSEDVEYLKQRLPNVLELVQVADPQWNHLDMVFSGHVEQMVFPKVLEYLIRYSI